MTDLQSVSFALRLMAGLFFVGLGLVFQGLAIFMAYETLALWTKAVPTISFITSYEFLKYPHWWVVIACGLAFVFGALVTHFTHWTP